MARVLQAVLLGPWNSMTGSKKVGLGMWKPNNVEDLAFLQERFEAGEALPVIDKRYTLAEIPAAMRYLEEGHAQGKVVITMNAVGVGTND